MQKTINLFNLVEEQLLSTHDVSSISAKPDDLDKEVLAILKALARAFSKSLKSSLPIPFSCNCESNFWPDGNSLRYGVSVVIPEPQTLQEEALESFRDACVLQSRSLVELSGILSKIQLLDGDDPGSYVSSEWFSKYKGSIKVDFQQVLENLVTQIRKTQILTDHSIDIVLPDGDEIKLDIPKTTSPPTSMRKISTYNLKILSATRKEDKFNGEDNERSEQVDAEFPHELSREIFCAFAEDNWLKVKADSVESYLDGEVILDRIYIKEIIGLAENQTKSLF